ncbi:MAG: NAD-dependent epimerase/dehydratase family protein [Anaerolineae bacterium]|nr:NAD-dependent epimerase/dehydratase family protein [Anaerolineae bacterium]
MHVLITGSSGQIGTNLALRLLEEGHTVAGIDQRPNPWTDVIPTQIIDLSADEALADLQSEFDIVVHLAANAKVHELVVDPRRALKNITVTFNVLEYCRQHELPLVFSSTREVYGDIHRYITREADADFAFTESPYSASKIAGEALIYSYAQCYDLRYLVFRFSNVYGRYDNDIQRMERVIPLFIHKIRHRQPITIYGEEKVLDFTYIDDCVDGIYRGIERLASGAVSNQTINLAYGRGNSLVKMARLIGAALSIEPEIHIQPPRVGEVTHYVADITKAQEMLGYNPTTPLEQGIQQAVEWSAAWWADHGEPEV